MFWLIDWINGQFEHVIKHLGHHTRYVLIRRSKIRVGIDLNQPYPKILIDQKVKPKKLPTLLAVVWIKCPSDAQKCVNYYILDSLYEVLLYI